MSMLAQNDLSKARIRSIFLTLLMVLSTTAALATTASASVARSYTTNRDPTDLAIGDFDCDGHNDLAVATDGTHTMTILYNDGNGNFNERQDIWVAGNQSRNADWDEFANVEQVEVGEFTGDSAIDIVIYQKNNPFKTNDQGAPAGEPGNVTIIENDGCGNRDWTIGQRYTHFWVWDMKVGDADQDGNDDIFVLELEEDLSRQNIVTYRSPITSTTQGSPTFLGASTQHVYQTFEVGDYGETQTVGLGGSCTDDDIFLLRGYGVDYTSGTITNPGNVDNVTIVEYSCTGVASTPGSYPADITSTNPTVLQFGHEFSRDLALADVGGNGYIDTIAMMDNSAENVSFKSASAQGNFGSTPSSTQKAYFGPYISYTIGVYDLNGDGEADFVNPTIAGQENTTDSAGGSESSYILTYPPTIQVTLSDGSGGHVSPLSYPASYRPSTVAVGQLAGNANSAVDIAVGHTNYGFGGWRDNLGWAGQYDTITIIEMDNKDMAVTDFDISPTDRFYGIVGEGTRNINVTVTNTGMDILNGQSADLDLVLQVVDEANSTNTTVYANDWDSPEIKSGCASGCTWTFEEYIDGATNWHLETNHSVGAAETGENFSANYQNPTDFMWAGNMKTNSTGAEWSGYGKNWDDAMVLNDVDLTGADRAFMSVELFRSLGFGALGQVFTDASGQQFFVPGDIWDDLALIEVYSEDSGWNLIACPGLATFSSACDSGASMWGGFDNDRSYKQAFGYYAEERVVGPFFGGTHYGWHNFTEEELGVFDLSPWANETVDIRFRFRTGFVGSTADDNESRWDGLDGFAVDNLTIWKQNTAFMPNPQTQSTTIGPFTNLEPGQDFSASIQADLVNDTTYRISAKLSSNSWDEQSINDDIVAYVTPLNLYDPLVESIDFFKPGSLYAQGEYDIAAITNNYGNTEVDFDVEATVYSATPSDVYCGSPTLAVCVETFEGGAAGIRYTERGDNGQAPKGKVYADNACSTPIFNSNAYWFGHPCETSTKGYEDAWVNQTLIIPNIDLTSMSGDFVSLNFEYYADTFYRTDSSGLNEPSDYATMEVDFKKGQDNYSALVIGQWNDYNEDDSCRVDEDGDGFTNSTNPFDFSEINNIGDPRYNNGESGNWEVFYNTDDLVKTASIDLTHLYILNTSSLDPAQWFRECVSLEGFTVDVRFEFQSDEDGRNGLNDGFKGVGFNNISLQEYTFLEVASYTTTRTNVDGGDSGLTTIASHEFETGVYRLDVRSVFDNTTVGTAWEGANELSLANNIERVIFNVEAVDVSIGSPNTLKCMDDQTLACVLPIDEALDHSWDYSAVNGVLAGSYTFNMDIHDMADGSLVYQDSFDGGSLQSAERINFSFTPWEGNSDGQQWVDGATYNISVYATLADGSETGNTRFFHATFAENIDVAILSDTSVRTSIIKEDLAILGMTYTQYEVNDFDTYFDSGWFTHYSKIILPWQDQLAAKDSQFGGGGYYEEIGEPNRVNILKQFMASGKTVQVHLAPYGSQIYGDSTTARLPFGLKINAFSEEDDFITFSTMDLADPYHPLMDNIDVNAFQGFDANSVVAESVLSTNSVSTTEVPSVCGGGYMENGGEFQRIIRSQTNIQDTVLGICNYLEGGLIISTIDVATHSERADSTTFPLLGNLLKFSASGYPDPDIGVQGAGLEITINDEVPKRDPSTSPKYATHYMKSGATLDFGYETTSTESLVADWIIDGPTNWDGSTLASGVTGHTNGATQSMTFCKADLASQTGCAQGEQWHITLMLHDEYGHARVIDVTVETNDIKADEFRPEADAVIDMRQEYEENVEFMETKTVSNQEWDVHRLILQGEGDDAELIIHFDASNSSDLDALEGNGIETYEWKVLFDAPYGDDSFDVDGHTFTTTAASGGMWSYKFKNVTVDSTGTTENQIRIELVVIDKAGEISEKHRMYFVVVPEGFGDAEPAIQWDNVQLNDTQFKDDELTISGSVLSGAETGEVYVEAAFFEENFSASSVMKYNMSVLQLWGKSQALGDGDRFEITLDMSSLYTAEPRSQRVYIKYYEGDYPNERWVTIKWIELRLPACQGLEADPQAIEAGGEFILDANGDCQWDGAWSYDPTTGLWTDNTQTDNGGDDVSSGLDTTMLLIGGVVLLLIVFGTLMFMRRGGDDDEAFAGMDSGFGAEALDPTEQYVQQLIAQGYPEETARAFAAQYVAGAAAQPEAAAQPAAAQPAAAQPAAAFDQAIYEQYYQQFVGQGYDAATAAAYAQQYAIQYAQSQQ